MGTEGDQPTRADLIARAWHLSTQEGLSTRAVAREMGIPHSTARDYIREAHDVQGWIDLLDRAEGRQALALRTVRVLDRLDKIMQDDERLVEVAPVWFKGANQLADLLGLKAPVRIQNENVNRPAEPMNPEIVAAVRNAQAKAARERAEIRGEGPLVIAPEDTGNDDGGTGNNDEDGDQ